MLSVGAMKVMSGAIGAALGASLASFGCVIADRRRTGESIVWPGSHCWACYRSLRPWENVPILSWLALRGKCSSCRAPIPTRYVLTEAAAAAIGVLSGSAIAGILLP